MTTPVLECRNVSISYYTRAGEVPAVYDFNLTVNPGEAVGIVGESGCGKSTVALAIMQYLGKNGAVTGGEIRFMGRDMRTMSEEELRRIRGSQISMVYQEPMASLNPSMLVKDQLIEVPMVHEGIDEAAATQRAIEILGAVRLPDPQRILNSYPHQLSGGQQQRVAIARALVNRPSILMADEPTGNLDSKTSRDVLALFASLNSEQGLTIVLVTHDMHVARNAKRSIVLCDGSVQIDTTDFEAAARMLQSGPQAAGNLAAEG
jgi:peptide/nickel transport system ATP-binding protein